MIDWPRALRAALTSGATASLGSAIALALAARREHRGVWQPLNATSHWLHGDAVADRTDVDLARTGVGYATNHAASIFWAVIFEAWRQSRGPARPRPMLRDASVMAVIAAAVDYGPTPKRFRPGWDLVLSRKGMAIAYAGLAIGLAGGALLTQERVRS